MIVAIEIVRFNPLEWLNDSRYLPNQSTHYVSSMRKKSLEFIVPDRFHYPEHLSEGILSLLDSLGADYSM